MIENVPGTEVSGTEVDRSPNATSVPARSIWMWAFVAIWLASAVGGLWVLWAYENRPGVAANSPGRWPAQTRLVRATERATLVLLAHPQCTCTRASLGELAEVLARVPNRPKTYVVFLKPSSFSDGWEKTDLWQTATGLPDVTVVRDDDGFEATRFGAATSGQTLLYDTRGALVFSGGITGARGHAGDNAGRAAVIALLLSGTGMGTEAGTEVDRSPNATSVPGANATSVPGTSVPGTSVPGGQATHVFGCPLFASSNES